MPPRIAGAAFVLFTSGGLFVQNESNHAAVCFAVYTLFFAVYAFAQRVGQKAIFGYLPAAYLPLTIIFALDFFEVDLMAARSHRIGGFVFHHWGIAIAQKKIGQRSFPL